MPEKQKLLLLGCGDLPSRLINRLNLDEWHIGGVRRSKIDHENIEMSYGSAADPLVVNKLIQQQPNHVILTLTPDGRSPEDYRDTYLRPALLVANGVQRWAPDCHLIFVSSTSIYGQDSGELVDETSATDPANETSRVLLESEKAIVGSGNPFTLLRFTGIYGPGRERLIERVRAGNFTRANKASWTNRIHSEDCAGVLAHLLQHPVYSRQGAGTLIGSDCEPVLNIEVERWLAEMMHLQSPPTESEIGALDTLSGKRCSNKKLLDSGFMPQFPSYKQGYQSLIDTN